MRLILLTVFSIATLFASAVSANPVDEHTFKIGDDAFLLDNHPYQIRCGEIHFARIPREYWHDRLRRCKAMGLNTVCAYLFWNFHEWQPGKFNWEGEHDAAEFIKIAQQEGLWVILRPGPYSCAEWEMGGLPWWLLKEKDIKLRTTDPKFMEPAKKYLKEVGRVLAPLQVTHGGPILMVQVENEYGSFGHDGNYMRALTQTLHDSGFDVPLFGCDPPGDLKRGAIPELFQVVNFGHDPAGGFKALRAMQPKGPLMCGEFYPGWFDTWGAPHHVRDMQDYLNDLEYMLKNKASFSIYMAHGGTTFGMWAGADRPYKPDTSSYDYDAPIREAGWSSGAKFRRTRELMSKYLMPGESLPPVPADNPTMTIAPFQPRQMAMLMDNLPQPITDTAPKNMEAYDQSRGCILYRATLPAGDTIKLVADDLKDFAFVSVDGKQVGVMDRRSRKFTVVLPARAKESQLDILVDTMGRVNFGKENYDPKGIVGQVHLLGENAPTLSNWQIFRVDLGDDQLKSLKWEDTNSPHATRARNSNRTSAHPAFYRGTFTVDKPQDTFLDLTTWGKGVLWVNGHCLARFWNIGPSQTAYLPAPWLKQGENEIILFDLLGPQSPEISGLTNPILDDLRNELDFSNQAPSYGALNLQATKPVLESQFPNSSETQTIMFKQPITGKQFCIESENAWDGKPYTVIAELSLIEPDGNSVPHGGWTIAYVDSEEKSAEDGSASNAIDGQTNTFWHTAWSEESPQQPHRLVIDLAVPTKIAGFRYVPRSDDSKPGRIKNYRIYIGNNLIKPAH